MVRLFCIAKAPRITENAHMYTKTGLKKWHWGGGRGNSAGDLKKNKINPAIEWFEYSASRDLKQCQFIEKEWVEEEIWEVSGKKKLRKKTKSNNNNAKTKPTPDFARVNQWFWALSARRTIQVQNRWSNFSYRKGQGWGLWWRGQLENKMPETANYHKQG